MPQCRNQNAVSFLRERHRGVFEQAITPRNPKFLSNHPKRVFRRNKMNPFNPLVRLKLRKQQFAAQYGARRTGNSHSQIHND